MITIDSDDGKTELLIPSYPASCVTQLGGGRVLVQNPAHPPYVVSAAGGFETLEPGSVVLCDNRLAGASPRLIEVAAMAVGIGVVIAGIAVAAWVIVHP